MSQAPTLTAPETPATAPETQPERPWVHEMVLVHRVFRKELGMLPALVAATAEGDRRRAKTLHRHYRFVTTVLHHHHTYEDEHLWPVLTERCPMDAELIARMETQHERVAALIASLPDAWESWLYVADKGSGARLAEILAMLSAALDEHLHDEEVYLLPIMEEHLSVTEWTAFGKHAARRMDKRKGLFWLGLMFEDITEEEFARFWAGLPAYVRLGYSTVGEGQYRRCAARVRGN